MAQGKGTGITIGSVMTHGGITVTPATTITDAIDLVVFHRINCLPVAEDGALRGLVTTTDLLQSLHQLLHELRPRVS
jgi:CBS domain-containing protein